MVRKNEKEEAGEAWSGFVNFKESVNFKVNANAWFRHSHLIAGRPPPWVLTFVGVQGNASPMDKHRSLSWRLWKLKLLELHMRNYKLSVGINYFGKWNIIWPLPTQEVKVAGHVVVIICCNTISCKHGSCNRWACARVICGDDKSVPSPTAEKGFRDIEVLRSTQKHASWGLHIPMDGIRASQEPKNSNLGIQKTQLKD